MPRGVRGRCARRVRTRISVLTSTIFTYAPVAAASPVLVCFMPDESTAMRSSTTRSRFVRRPPALQQMGGVASDDGVRVRHRRDAECSIRHNPVTPDGEGGSFPRPAPARLRTRSSQPAARLVRVPDAVVLVPVARVGVVLGGRVLVEDAVVLVPLLLVELRGTVHDDGVAVDVEPKHGRRRGGGPLEDGARARWPSGPGPGRRRRRPPRGAGARWRGFIASTCAWANFE